MVETTGLPVSLTGFRSMFAAGDVHSRETRLRGQRGGARLPPTGRLSEAVEPAGCRTCFRSKMPNIDVKNTDYFISVESRRDSSWKALQLQYPS
ncbi:hypothetical protein [Sedimenticola hydrogenitrophicus]|uniref:hypothetical protein n=1 Tax=Sedimenticola hydrogenitrophicus TaxID=2967975 RepID=UPI0021A7478E|nr:hypothetical protein [Sedimenticola hydrogenitrophicus]